jgi:tetratricopeptide (TPR) repeat protein
MDMVDAIAPLKISDEAFLVASLIERCPKSMMLRELIVNAIEASGMTASGVPTVSIKAKMINGVPKLTIWNTGPGLSADELDQICDIASSVRKVIGLDGNFGMGAKVASLPSNRLGVIYRSCKAGRVNQVILGESNGVYGRLLRPERGGGGTARVLDVTGDCDAEYDLSVDWTEVLLMGNRVDQDTVTAPYDGSPAMPSGWIATYLAQRFFRVPSALGLFVATDTGIDRFHALADRQTEFTRYQRVSVPSGITVHYYYLEGPGGRAEANQSLRDVRGVAGIVYKDEIFGLRTESQWVIEAPAFGISFGARGISVLIELPSTASVQPEAYRQFLRLATGDQHQITIADYAETVRTSMPVWLRQIISEMEPPQADYLAEISRELQELVMELCLIRSDPPPPVPAPTPSGGTKGSVRPTLPLVPVYERAPEMIALRDHALIDERGLKGRAARYFPTSRQLFLNLLYPAILRMALHLQHLFADFPDQAQVTRLSQETAEWSISRMTARALIYTLTKSAEGWSNDDIARAQSPECLTVVADNYESSLQAAQRRLVTILSPDLTSDQNIFAEVGDTVQLRARQRREVELAGMEQGARHELEAGRIPPPAPLLRRMSEIANRRGDIATAFEWAHKAVEADPNDAWSLNNLAGLLLTTGDVNGAVQAAEQAVALSSDKPAAAFLRRMAEVEVQRGNKAAALEWSRRAVALDTSDPWSRFDLATRLLEVGELEQAENEAHQALALGPQPPPSHFVRQISVVYARRGNPDAALEWGRQAVALDDGDMWSQFHLAGLLLGSGELEGAERAARQAVVLNATNPSSPILRRLSEVEFARRNLEGALQWARRAVDLDPADAWSQCHLSAVLQRMGDVAGAARASEMAIDQAGAVVPAAFFLRLSEVRAKQGDVEEALTLARQAVGIDSGNPWAAYQITRLLLLAQDFDGAEAAAKRALELSPQKKRSIFERCLSEVYAARKDTTKALGWARSAILTDENDAWSQSHLATILLSVGDLDGAERAARLAIILGTSSEENHFSNILRQVESRRAA